MIESVRSAHSCPAPPIQAMSIFFVHSIFSIAPLPLMGIIGVKTSPIFIPEIDILLIALIAIFPIKRIHTRVIRIQIIHFFVRPDFLGVPTSEVVEFLMGDFAYFFAGVSLCVLKFDMP